MDERQREPDRAEAYALLAGPPCVTIPCPRTNTPTMQLAGSLQ
jgi:hypothetical protein